MQSINLQITPNGVLPKVYASQFDVGREIQFNLYDGATAYIPPVGTQIRFEGKKSDGNGFSYNCSYTDNVVTVVLTDQMTVFAEEVPCELRLADYSGDIGTLNVILAVEKSPIDENTPMSDTEIPAIIELARTEQYNAEAWAEGTRNGVPVDPDDPTYNNNAKYYAEHSTASMANLSDTDIQNLSDGQIVKYDSVAGKWKNVDDNLDDVNDVDITSPTDGDVLIYDGNSGKWVNGQGGSGSSTLAGLTDVNLTTPTNNQVLKYDSVNQEWINGDAPSGAGGSTVTITTAEAALYGETVTITDGVDTFTGTFDNAGNCEIQGVAITGTATVSATGGGQTATASLTMPYFGNYSTTLAFFSATVNVTFPYANGASCTLSDGVTTLTANTSPMAFNVPNTGTWTATVTLDGQTKTDSATITSDGQTASLTIEYGTINLSYDNDFKGETITCISGGTTITKTAPNDANAMVFYPPTTGNWSISGTAGGVTYTASPDPIVVSSLSTAVSANLQTFATINVTLYGAKEDTITFTDAAGVAHTEVFASGQTSKSVSIKIDPNGSTITFTSSVSKNPSNLSQNYSKNVSLTTSTTEVSVMPDNALYWYGYQSSDLTTMSDWAWGSGTYVAPSYLTNYVDCNAASGKFTGIASNSTVASGKVIKTIAKGETIGSGIYGSLLSATNKNVSNANIDVNINSSAVALYSGTSTSADYIAVGANNGRKAYVYALWYE